MVSTIQCQNKIHRYYAELFISNMLFCSSFQQDVVYSLSAVYSISNVHQHNAELLILWSTSKNIRTIRIEPYTIL